MSHVVLLNASTINKGGAIQAVVAFVRLALEASPARGAIEWKFALSKEVLEELEKLGCRPAQSQALCLQQSPARSSAAAAELKAFADQYADLVFTFFGPAYVRFRQPHLCGVADGWVTHSTALAFSMLPGLREKLHMLALCAYKAFWFRRADAWIVEQENARAGLVSRLRIPRSKIHVVENNCSQIYFTEGSSGVRKERHDPIRILTFSAYYAHKALELIPAIALHLRRDHKIDRVKFVLTVPHDQYEASRISERARELQVQDLIENAGYIALVDGPSLYRGCDIALLPSTLETFSAAFPEAMHMGLPIVASNLDFARNVCGDAALYFKPLDAADAAHKLAEIIDCGETGARLVAAGYRQLQRFPSPHEKYAHYVSIINQLMESQR